MAKNPRKPTAPRNPADIIHLKLRLPESLRQTLARAALHHRQSMNAEIIERLEQSFRMPEAAQSAEAVLQKIYALINPPELIPPKSDERK